MPTTKTPTSKTSPTTFERSRTAWRTPTGLVPLVVVASAVAGALSDASPTGTTVGDVFWTALAAATLSRATVDARRWAWFPLAGAAATVGQGLLAITCGVAALGGAFGAGFFAARRRWVGAVVGGLAAQALLRGYSYGFTGLPTIVAIAASAPVLISAYRNASSRTKRLARTTAVVGAVVVTVLTIFTVVSAVRARDRVQTAIEFGDQAVAAADAGDQVLASSLIGAAADELGGIAGDFEQPWLYPARFVPLLGPHATVLHRVADAGEHVAQEAAAVLEALDPDTLLTGPGRIDVDAVGRLVVPMDTLRTALTQAVADVDDVDTTWLANPAEERVDELVDELRARFDDVRVADELVAITPQLLGAGGPRRYLVMFLTPAEMRGAGGFAGNWAEIVVDRGELSLAEVGRGDDVTQALPVGGIVVPRNIQALYSGFELETTFQNLPVVPDFPTVASLAQTQFETAFGRPIDGVIGIDHAGMAGIVELTGAIEVDGRSLDAAGVREFVLRGQYLDYGDDNDRRLEVLDELTRASFDRLVATQLPAPGRFVDVFGPLVRGQHVRVVSFDNDEAVALGEVGLDDAFPVAVGQDLLAVVTQNLGENKIDIYLDRDIGYHATVDPDTGEITATLRVALTNNAPAEGLPQAIIGNNDQGLPFGTNRVRVQIYSPLDVTAVRLDGVDVEVIAEAELGWSRYRRDLWLDPGQGETLELELSGLVDVTNGYVLDVLHQPLSNVDAVQVQVDVVGDREVAAQTGLGPEGRAMVSLESDLRVGLVFDR